MLKGWRPAKGKNLYCIPDLHGAIELLNPLLDTILPLGDDDALVFLGDYIDRHPSSHEVIDRLIELSKQKNIHFLKGNHEFMLLVAAGRIKKSFDSQKGNFKMWIANGGFNTLQGYLKRRDSGRSPLLVQPYELKEIIPKEHLDFMESTLGYLELEDHLFVHGGCDPFKPLDLQPEEALTWDRSLYEFCRKGHEPTWDKAIVTGHSGPQPLILDKFLMLDCGSPGRLMVAELYSRKSLIKESDRDVFEEDLVNEDDLIDNEICNFDPLDKDSPSLPVETIKLNNGGEVLVIKSFLSKERADSLLEELKSIQYDQRYLTIKGKKIPLPRLTAWYGDEGAVYRYSGIEEKPREWIPSLKQLRDLLEGSFQSFNSLLVNYYRNGRDSIGLHADDEEELGENPTIASISLGAERIFRLQQYKGNLESPTALSIPLHHGDLLIMRGTVQKYWKHAVDKDDTVEPRINLTFRKIQ